MPGFDTATPGLSAFVCGAATVLHCVAVSLRIAPLLFSLLVCSALLTYEDVDRHVRAAAMLMRWTAAPGPERLRVHGAHPVATSEITLDTDTLDARTRRIEAIEYRPTDRKRPPPIMLVHGAHYRGMRESRLKQFALALASAGFVVTTPQIDELTQHHVDAATIPTLRSLAALVARRARYETVGVVGISFAGSLALLAAADASQSAAIGSVTAVGSYSSLDRLGRWYAGDAARGPDDKLATRADSTHDASTLRPHPYGARVLFQAHAETVFGAYANDARRVLNLYLHDRSAQARKLAETLPDPPRADLLALVGPSDRPLSDKLRSLLRAHAPQLAAVSPHGQLRGLRVPVLLVHGADDPIIPSTETRWLAQDVPRPALRASLVTSAVRHAELQDKPSLAEVWALVRWAALLLEVNERQARSPLLR